MYIHLKCAGSANPDPRFSKSKNSENPAPCCESPCTSSYSKGNARVRCTFTLRLGFFSLCVCMCMCSCPCCCLLLLLLLFFLCVGFFFFFFFWCVFGLRRKLMQECEPWKSSGSGEHLPKELGVQVDVLHCAAGSSSLRLRVKFFGKSAG